MLQIDLWKRILIWGLVGLGLLLALPNAFYNRVETHNDAMAAIEAGADPQALQQEVALWPEWMPSSLVNLGLDLRGGAHLLAEVQVEDVYEARIESMWPEIRDVLREERDRVGPIRLQPIENAELHVRLVEKPEEVDYAASVVRGLARPVTSLTGVNATDIEVSTEGASIVVRLSEAEKRATDERTVRQALEIVRRRIDEVGTREPTIQRQGTDRILIQVPGIGSAAELKEIIGTTAQLTFQPVVSRTSNADERPGPGNEILPSLDEQGLYYILESAPVVTGDELVDAQPDFDQNGRPAVSFRFNPTGARKFGDYTAENIGNPFAIVLDGGGGERAGHPGAYRRGLGDHHRALSRWRKAPSSPCFCGPARCPRGWSFSRSAPSGPELGADSIEAGQDGLPRGLRAGARSTWRLSYGLFGIFANIALIINVGLIFGLLSTDRGHADLAGDRRDRADDRHGGGRQRARLRADPRGDADIQGPGPGDPARLRKGAERRLRRCQRDHLHDGA
jgi:SecD/SecF fusion protein